MKWEIGYNKAEGILDVTTTGLITWDENRLMTEEVLTAAKQHDTQKVLVDHRKLQSNLTVLQIDDLPQMFRDVGVGSEYRVAILFDPDSPKSSNFKFFENVSIISSLQFKVFSKSDEAVKWLKVEEKKAKTGKK